MDPNAAFTYCTSRWELQKVNNLTSGETKPNLSRPGQQFQMIINTNLN